MFRVLCLLCIISIFLQLAVSKNVTVTEKKSEDKDALRSNEQSEKKGELYYMVLIRFIQRENGLLNVCGGTLIGESRILTAAHCFEKEGNSCTVSCKKRGKFYEPSRFIALAGYHRGFEYFQANGQGIYLHTFTIHPDYSHPNKDVAIAHTKSPFEFDNNVSALPFASKYINYGSLKCNFSAFGSSFGNVVFKHAEVKLVPDKECSRRHGKNMRDFLCTVNVRKYREEGGGVVVCTNTGDPSDKGDGVVVGLECAKQDEEIYFTRISSYSDFIANESCEASFLVPYVLLTGSAISLAFYELLRAQEWRL